MKQEIRVGYSIRVIFPIASAIGEELQIWQLSTSSHFPGASPLTLSREKKSTLKYVENN